jgi:anthranilate synthase component 1
MGGSIGGVLIREWDIEPNLLALHCAKPDRYPYLLESVAHGTPQGRYDILFAFPGSSLRLNSSGTVTCNDREAADHDFLNQLDRWWRKGRTAYAGDASAPPFRGGWFLYLGYELAAQIEPTLDLPSPPHRLPVAFAMRIPAAVVRDRMQRRTWLVAEADHTDLLESLSEDLRDTALSCADGALLSTPLREDTPNEYLQAVERAKRYIVDGDIFQANLSRTWRGRLRKGATAAEIYRRLRDRNPGPFAGLVVDGESAIISSSPERLIQVTGDRIQTRPIAGTRPRGRHRQADGAHSRELLAHPKERAEHIMLIDLERNDLGRIARPGTVDVNELMVLESYSHVHHIVSNVRGRLRPGVTPGQIVRAVFPGGTITGCPKVRCMEIIAELEGLGRGPYTGAMGYLNRDGDMDLNILIRTIIKDGHDVSLRAGAGIVADSVPGRELEETRHKAQGLIAALEG